MVGWETVEWRWEHVVTAAAMAEIHQHTTTPHPTTIDTAA